MVNWLPNADTLELIWTGLAFFGSGEWSVLLALVLADLMVAYQARFERAMRLQAWTNVVQESSIVLVFVLFAYSGILLVLAPPGPSTTAPSSDPALIRAAYGIRWSSFGIEALLIALGFVRLLSRFAISRAYLNQPHNRRMADTARAKLGVETSITAKE